MPTRHPQHVTTLQIVDGTVRNRGSRSPSPPDRREVIDLNVRSDQQVLLSVTDACERLGVGRTFLYQLMRTSQLEYVKAGRLRKIPVEAITAYVDSLRSRQSQ